MKSYQSYIVQTDQSDMTVETYLKQVLQISGRKIQKLTRQKGVKVNNKPSFLGKKLLPGDTVHILSEKDVDYGVVPQHGLIDILYEDDHLFVLNKPPHQLVHPAGRTTEGTLANFLAWQLKERGIVSTIRPLHRLDRDTSGCIIFAKNAQSQALLEAQLKANRIKRTYWALVKGVPPQSAGTIRAPIGPHPTHPNRRAVTPQGEEAITHYHVLVPGSAVSLLELSLETGRTHQIRVHLAHLGCPIIGDAMYGVRSPLIGRQALHAKAVHLQHLISKADITVQAPLPPDFRKALTLVNISLPE